MESSFNADPACNMLQSLDLADQHSFPSKYAMNDWCWVPR